MAKISLSGQEKSIGSIFSWYEDQMEAINDLRIKISTVRSEKFQKSDLTEINYYFNNSEQELEHLVCLDLISATEAFLTVDYHNRIRKRERTKIGKLFKEIDRRTLGDKVSLEDDIIEAWKATKKKAPFSDFIGLLKYRHWLAHGRYWTPKLGREYSFDIAYQIVENVFKVVSK